MSNIFTQSITPPFTKQSIRDFFIAPMFLGEDIRGAVTVRTDIKGTERLNKISRPSMITRPKVNPGFTPGGTFELTHQDITVKPMAIEFEQNGREFWGSVVEQLLASGYKEDDVENMKNPDIWNKIVLPIIADAGQQDLIRQMWFADPEANVLDSNNVPTGVIDENYSGYNGFFFHLIHDLMKGIIPSSQNVDPLVDSAGTKQKIVLTLSVTSDPTSVFITINDQTLSEDFDTDAGTTVSNWIASHKSSVEALWGAHGVTVTNTGAALSIQAKVPGAGFSFSYGSVGGSASWAESGAVAAVAPGKLSDDAADTLLESMIDVMPAEMLELKPVFMLSRSVWRNLLKTWKSLGTETANMIQFKGVNTPVYEGIPILIRPDWDMWAAARGGVLPHRVLLSPQKNLLFGTDGMFDSEDIETWYNQDLQLRRYRVQYKAQTAYLHKELIVTGGLSLS